MRALGRRAAAASIIVAMAAGASATVAAAAGATTPVVSATITAQGTKSTPNTVIFTDTIVGVPRAAAPSGTVTWSISGAASPTCSASTALHSSDGSSTATATCTVEVATSGDYAVSAAYGGDTTYESDAGHPATLGPLALVGADWSAPSDPTTSGTDFNECPAIGYDYEGCAAVIVLSDSGAAVDYNPVMGPYDNQDDSLIGVVNDTTSPGVAVTSVTLESLSSIFAFDGDGICSGDYGAWTGSANCPTKPSGGAQNGGPNSGWDYEGPNTSFSGFTAANNFTQGTVDFPASGGLTPGTSTYFSLESALSSATGFTVILAPQTVSFSNGSGGASATDAVTLPDTTYQAQATGSAGGAITYSTTSSNCQVASNGDVTFSGSGSCVIDASAAAIGSYAASTTDATLTIAVSPAPVVISVAPTPVSTPPPPLTLTIVAPTLAVGQGSAIDPSASVSGLNGPDTATLAGVVFTYEGTGSTTYGPSTTAPTAPGTYSLTPSSGTVTVTPAADQSDYSSTYEYVAGSLVIIANAVVPTSPPKSAPPTRIVELRPFSEGSYALTASLKSQIEKLAREIKQSGYRQVQLTGYTDNVFTPAFNTVLNQERASIVKARLTADLKALGVKGVMIETVASTGIVLADSNVTSKGRALNRRVVATLRAG